MKRTKCWVSWVLANTTWAGLVIAAVEGNKYAGNLVKFLCWALFLLSISLATERKSSLVKEFLQKGVPAKVDFLYDIGILAVLVAYGWFFYSVLYLVHALLLLGVKNLHKEESISA